MNSRRTLNLLAAFAVALASAGCPRGDDPVLGAGNGAAVGQGAPIVVEAASPAAEPIAAAPVAAEPVAPQSAAAAQESTAPPMPRRAVVTKVEVSRIDVERAEDGRGATVAARAPIAIEITAEAWPVRALDPVLHVGDLEFRHYTFPRVNVLRYVAADAALVPAGAAAWIQYGDDDASRVEVAGSLEVPR